jgi:hypothetical protein
LQNLSISIISTQLVREDAYFLKKGLHIHPFLGEDLVLHKICINGQKGCKEGLLNMQSLPPVESIRASDVICCSLDTKSCAKEASRSWGFCDGIAVEASVNKGGKRGAATAFDLPALSPFLASLSVLSLAFWASFSALPVAFLASLSLYLRILFFSFSGSRLRSTSTSSSCS